MKATKLLIILSLAAVLKLNCASNASETLAYELLGVDKPSAAVSTDKHADGIGLSASDPCFHRSACGLEDSNIDDVKHLKSRIAERKHRDWYRETSQMSWPFYLMRIFKDSFYYLFGNEKTPAPQVIAYHEEATAEDEGDGLGSASTGTGSSSNSLAIVAHDLMPPDPKDKSMKSYSEIVYDQGIINSCTANALGFIIRYWAIKNGKNPTDFTSKNPDFLYPSRLYHYYNSRAIAGKNSDGKMILDLRLDGKAIDDKNVGSAVSAERALLSLDKYGTCPERIEKSVKANLLLVVGDVAADVKDSAGRLVVDNSQISSANSYSITLNSVGMEYLLDNVTSKKQPNLDSYLFSCNSGIVAADKVLNAYEFVAEKIRYAYLGNDKNQFTVINSFRDALREGNPIFWGARVYTGFTDAKLIGGKFVPLPTDLIPDPNDSKKIVTQSPMGGHAMVIVGWGNYDPADSKTNYFKVLNSWGPNWGDGGFCYFPEAYITGITQKLPNTVSAYAVWFQK